MSKFSCVFFGNPTNKTVTGTTSTWELLIANHLDQSLWPTNQNIERQSGPIYYTLSFEVHNCVAPFTSHGTVHECGAKKPISWAKPAHFHIFTINFSVWSRILSTSGDALNQFQMSKVIFYTYLRTHFLNSQPTLISTTLNTHVQKCLASYKMLVVEHDR
jgi:hypothetical protein